MILSPKLRFPQTRPYGCCQYTWANFFDDPRFLKYIQIFREDGTGIHDEAETVKSVTGGNFTVVAQSIRLNGSIPADEVMECVTIANADNPVEFHTFSLAVESEKIKDGHHAVLWLVSNRGPKINWAVEIDPWKAPRLITEEYMRTRRVFSIAALAGAEAKEDLIVIDGYYAMQKVEDIPWIIKSI